MVYHQNACKYMKVKGIKQEIKDKIANDSQELQSTAQKTNYIVFWKINRGRNDSKNIEIIISSILKILSDAGFARYDMGNGYSFVQIIDNIAEEVNETQIQDYFFESLKSLPDELETVSKDEIQEKLYKGIESYFSRKILARLTLSKPLSFIQDTKEAGYLFFKNACIVVTGDSIRSVPYNLVEGNIWKNQIIQRNFESLDFQSKNVDNICQTSAFAKFVYLICGSQENRFIEFSSIIGYLLHSYEFTKRKAVCFTDSSLEDSNNGRSGKTLLAKSLGRIRSYTEIAGKDFKADNKHKFQLCKLDTQIVNINDLKSNFCFEVLYNDITEGISVERKNQTPFVIRPKIILSTNKPLKIEGGSDRDRIIEFEFNNYFSDKYTPEDEFKQRFFEDWSYSEWNSFDNFLIWCLQNYLKNGVSQPKNENLPLRKLKEDTSPDFLEWTEDFLNPSIENVLNASELIPLFNPDLFENFVSNYETPLKFTQTRFNKWLKKYLDFKNIKIQDYNKTKNYKGRSVRGFYVVPF